MSARRYVPRRHARAEVASIAFLIDGQTPTGPFLVENLSAGGALLTSEIRALGATGGSGVVLGVGHAVVVQLRLPTVAHWLHLRATIVREAPCSRRRTDTFSFAVKFRDLSPEDEDLIHSSVLNSLEASGEPSSSAALVFDESAQDREGIGRLLVELRQRAIDAETFFDVLRLMQKPHVDIDCVFADLSVREAGGRDVLAFLAESFPRVRRVLMGRAASDAELSAALSSGLAHAIVVKPPSLEALSRALGHEPPRGPV